MSMCRVPTLRARSPNFAPARPCLFSSTCIIQSHLYHAFRSTSRRFHPGKLLVELGQMPLQILQGFLCSGQRADTRLLPNPL